MPRGGARPGAGRPRKQTQATGLLNPKESNTGEPASRAARQGVMLKAQAERALARGHVDIAKLINAKRTELLKENGVTVD